MPDSDGFLGDSILETKLLSREIEIPAEFACELDMLKPVSGEYHHLAIHQRKVTLMLSLLDRVGVRSNPLSWAALKHDLGLLHAKYRGPLQIPSPGES